ncbi:hypothetical protein [Longimicrobium sp.]|uniref:hypothetical protein n=1 Tax=Longimicrobium sp. TaxID=2029185 RepID=UPI002F93157A
MFRILSIFLLVASVPLAGQTPDSGPVLRSGSSMRLILRAGPDSGYIGSVLARSGDSLRVITPELGLAQVALEDVARFEVESSNKTGLLVGLTAAGGAVAGIVQGASVAESLLLGTVFAAVAVLPGSASEPRRWRRVDPAVSWRGGPGGARVRLSAPGAGFSTVELRLQDFQADTLFFMEGGIVPSLPLGEVTSLELSLGYNRRRGVAVGSVIGGIAGIVYGGSVYLRAGGDPVVLLPIVGIGLALGGGFGGVTGYLLAPRRWQRVPLSGPAPPSR